MSTKADLEARVAELEEENSKLKDEHSDQQLIDTQSELEKVNLSLREERERREAAERDLEMQKREFALHPEQRVESEASINSQGLEPDDPAGHNDFSSKAHADEHGRAESALYALAVISKLAAEKPTIAADVVYQAISDAGVDGVYLRQLSSGV